MKTNNKTNATEIAIAIALVAIIICLGIKFYQLQTGYRFGESDSSESEYAYEESEPVFFEGEDADLSLFDNDYQYWVHVSWEDEEWDDEDWDDEFWDDNFWNDEDWKKKFDNDDGEEEKSAEPTDDYDEEAFSVPFEEDDAEADAKIYEDISVSYDWNAVDMDNRSFTLTATINEKHLEYARGKRYFDCSTGYDDFRAYVEDPVNRMLMKDMAEPFRDIAEEKGWSDEQLISVVVQFVQSLTYEYDIDFNGDSDYTKFPFETILDGRGDCEDSSLLLASLLLELGYDSGYAVFPGHMITIVNTEVNSDEARYCFENNGDNFFLVETTNPGWEIGEIDPKYIDYPILLEYFYAV